MSIVSIIFGDKYNVIEPDNICGKEFWYKTVQVIFQHQVHENRGMVVTQKNIRQLTSCLVHDSDYLITNLKNIGIGVLTADCLPIALVDEKHQAIGMVHAGWRGTIGKIIVNAIDQMNICYGTITRDLKVFFGPCALPCCYQIDKQFIDQLPAWAKKSIKNDCFDLVGCNEELLLACGVLSSQLNKSACKCTICNDNFCSHRRNPISNARQMSIIWIN